jgi:tetratricopeptide (TPR) repeat protein
MPDNPPQNRRPRKPRSTQTPPSPVAGTPPPSEPAAFLKHVLTLTNRRAEVRALAAAEMARLHPPQTPASQIKRQATLKALKTWHSVASARLKDLQAGRAGIDPAALVRPTTPRPETAKLMRRLVVGLSKNASRISTLEGAQGRWHVAAKAAREGIALRRDTARAVAGKPLRPNARLHLKLSHATFMLEGNSPRMRKELKEAIKLNPKSKGLAYWLARYEIMVGNYPAAHEAVSSARDYPPIRHLVTPMLQPESSKAPWLIWPCNFYTYRYTLADTSKLRDMHQVLAALYNDPTLTDTWHVTFKIPLAVIEALKDRALDGSKAIASLLFWNQANLAMERSNYAAAARSYDECQRAIVNYFASRYPKKLKLSLSTPPDESGSDESPARELENALHTLASNLIRYDKTPSKELWKFFRDRYATLTLEELHKHDWQRPNVVPLAYEFQVPIPDFDDFNNPAAGFVLLAAQMAILRALQHSGEKVEEKIDAPLLAIALVFCPMAIAEANRLRRHFDKALTQCTQLLERHSKFQILSEVVEKPFVKILNAQILMDKADGQYKSRATAKSPARNRDDQSLKYQGLEAAETYQGVLTNFQDLGQYVNRVNAGVASTTLQLEGLLQHTFHPIAAKESDESVSPPPLTPADRKALVLIGKKIQIETIKPRQGDYPEPDRRIGPHESLLEFVAPGGGETPTAMRETNPVIYSLIVQARARLLQMEAGLNYLGYSDEYIPPWRFQFLLDRARYFVEHAKNAQREYLNFLSNAEREEFQELTAAQGVEMEKSNIRIETARVEQSKL